MDFTTAHAVPVRVKIDGLLYDLPRFLMPQLREWGAARQNAAADVALKQLTDPEHRARFYMLFQPAPIDVMTLLEDGTGPEGVTFVLTSQMDAAKVPEEKRDAVLANADPAQLRTLAKELLSATATKEYLKSQSNDAGPGTDPTSGQPPESAGSPATTSETAPASPANTAAA